MTADRIEITSKEECCGCAACHAACPTKCISMVFDEEGFEYPDVNKELCISCGRCVSVCPLREDNSCVGALPVSNVYAIANKDETVRSHSTSGGAFDVLARYVIDRGGIVVGAFLDPDMQVVHGIARTADEIGAFYGSKYVQSNLVAHDIFRQVRSELDVGKMVLFSGTPCQVQGMRTFLGRDYEKLILCDVVCHAVPSPKAWQDYVRLQENAHGSKMNNAIFRNKTYGYHAGSMKVEFENGDVYYGSARVDYMQKAFFANVISRPSCYSCKFRKTERCSNFTIFDCWNFTSHTGLHDDNLGWTNVICRGERTGEILIEEESNIVLHEVDLPSVLANDGVMARRNISRNPKREEFLACLYRDGFDIAIERYLPISRMDRVFESHRGALEKTGILPLLKKLKKTLKRRL